MTAPRTSVSLTLNQARLLADLARTAQATLDHPDSGVAERAAEQLNEALTDQNRWTS